VGRKVHVGKHADRHGRRVRAFEFCGERLGCPATVDKPDLGLGALRYRGRNMAEPQDDISGMGSVPRGPSFLPWTGAEPAPGEPSRPSQDGPHLGPPRSRWPTVISILAIVLVAAVVAGASLVAYWGDTHVAAPPRPQTPPSLASPSDRIDFVSEDGTGQLIMRTRSWINDGQVPPVSGSYLRVEVELICTSGEVDYDPYHFQAFDRSGQLFEMAVDGTGDRVLPVGTLQAGERIRGTVAFDMPRGDVTLLMSDDSEKTVTALRVPD
jgi:hypothetical protein